MLRLEQMMRRARHLICSFKGDRVAEAVDPLQWLLAKHSTTPHEASIGRRLCAVVTRSYTGRSDGRTESARHSEQEHVAPSDGVRSYICRVRLRTSPLVRIEIPEERTKIHIESIGRSVTFVNESRGEPAHERWIIVSCGGFESPKEAETFGKSLRATLLSVATELGIGLDPGEDKATGGLARRLLLEAATRGRHVANSVHGLAVHEDLPGLHFFSASAQINLSVSWNAFIERFTGSPLLTQELPEKFVAPFELVCLSALDISERARFMLLYTALETMSDQRPRPVSEVAIINQLLTTVRESVLTQDARKQLANALGGLKRESSRSACKRLVSDLGIPKHAERFEQIATIRNQLSHPPGRVPADQLNAVCGHLGEILRDALRQTVDRTCTSTGSASTSPNGN